MDSAISTLGKECFSQEEKLQISLFLSKSKVMNNLFQLQKGSGAKQKSITAKISENQEISSNKFQ